jgi:hypothetical protein
LINRLNDSFFLYKMSISYIIASYSGKDHTSNRDIAEIVLQVQIDSLLKLFAKKKELNIPNSIKEVIIVCPPVPTHNQFTAYYDFDTWKPQMDAFNVVLKRIEYVGANQHHSYDQWIQGWQNATCSHYFIMEDDYFLNDENPSIDLELLDLYASTFPSGIGALSVLCSSDETNGLHQALTFGLMSKQTVEQIPNPLATLYSYTGYPQLSFSKMLADYHIPMVDWFYKYTILFWNSYLQRIELFNDNTLPLAIVPVQLKITMGLPIYRKDCPHVLSVKRDGDAKRDVSLFDLVNDELTDKNTLHSYLGSYETLFCKRRATVENVLEIGIFKGGGIQLWHDYFKEAFVYGVDIDTTHYVLDPQYRINIITGDAYDTLFFIDQIVRPNLRFDVIIDDGPHTLASMKTCITYYSSLLTDNGILVIEDIQDVSWINALKDAVPDYLKSYIHVYDTRHIKNRYDDILFVIDKSV